MSTDPAFPLIEVEGPARERGRSYGSQAAERIARASELYYGSLARLDLAPGVVRTMADDFLAAIERFDADQAEEIRGIAEGSGVPLEEVVVINARRELITMAERGGETNGSRDDVAGDECTAAAILPEVSATGQVFHGQNWDTSPAHSEHALVLRIRRDDGPDILCFTEAGQLARSGFNAAGVAITGNHLESDRDYVDVGVPLPMIRRAALSTEHYALAISVVYATRKSGSNNMMLSHAGGEIINVECAPDESFLLYERDGVLTHANHWESVAALCKLRDTGATNDTGLAATPCSTYRGNRMERLLRRQLPAITFEGFRGVFLDAFASPFSICRPPRRAAVGTGMSATAATVVFNAAEGYLDAARLPAVDPTFTRYRLSGGAAEVLPAAELSEPQQAMAR